MRFTLSLRTKICWTLMYLIAVSFYGCITPSNGPLNGPHTDVVEMDQNTGLRVYSRNQRGIIGWLKKIGVNVMLNGSRLRQDAKALYDAEVTTGVKSGAVIELCGNSYGDCTFEISELNNGRIYGLVGRCRHNIVTRHGVMETLGGRMEYHVGARGLEMTTSTAVNGQAGLSAFRPVAGGDGARQSSGRSVARPDKRPAVNRP